MNVAIICRSQRINCVDPPAPSTAVDLRGHYCVPNDTQRFTEATWLLVFRATRRRQNRWSGGSSSPQTASTRTYVHATTVPTTTTTSCDRNGDTIGTRKQRGHGGLFLARRLPTTTMIIIIITINSVRECRVVRGDFYLFLLRFSPAVTHNGRRRGTDLNGR